jgi:hypothetical protein
MLVRTAPPEMTHTRALLVKLMERYLESANRLTLLEVHKLAYFAQEAGEPLKLNYAAGTYGPHAPSLNKVLERIEGHFTRGYGDSPKPDRDVVLMPGAVEKASAFLETSADSKKRLKAVADLIEGFETPYGMELLATVHWVGRHNDPPAPEAGTAVAAVNALSARMRRMFQPAHIRVARQTLQDAGWLGRKSSTP